MSSYSPILLGVRLGVPGSALPGVKMVCFLMKKDEFVFSALLTRHLSHTYILAPPGPNPIAQYDVLSSLLLHNAVITTPQVISLC